MCLGWGTERRKILAQSGSKKLFAQSSQLKNHRLTELFIVGASEAFVLHPLYYRWGNKVLGASMMSIMPTPRAFVFLFVPRQVPGSISSCPNRPSRNTQPLSLADVSASHFREEEPLLWNPLALCRDKAWVYFPLGHNTEQFCLSSTDFSALSFSFLLLKSASVKPSAKS